MRTAILILMTMLALTSVSPVWAETLYVSDEMVVMLRSGESEKHKIIKMPKSGTPLEVLQAGEEYHFVRAPDGTEGYVLKQFLTNRTPKALVIARLEREREKLQNQLQQLQTRQSELTTNLAASRQEHSTVETTRIQLEKDLAALQEQHRELRDKSAHVVELAHERDQLEEQNNQLASEVGTLRQEMESTLYTGAIRWFMAGGGVFLTGWIIGKTSRKKKKGFSN
ncbi:MAG: TIGR04211 family SH3 domain-containing protein [Desulfuromonadales bacterium]